MDADVAIVGLGAAGSLSAWRLASRGAKVIGFERFKIGHDRGSSHGGTRAIRTAFGSLEYVRLLTQAFPLWRQLEAETRIQLLTLTRGLVIGALQGELVSGVLESARLNGLEHCLLDKVDMERLYPSHRLANGEVGVIEEQAGYLRPERAVGAATARAEELGARIMPMTMVKSVEAGHGYVTIQTDRGPITAAKALITAGPWTLKLLPDLGLPLAVERQVVAWFTVKDPAAFRPERFPIFIHELTGSRFRYGFPTTDGRSVKLAVHHEGTHADPDNIDRDVHEADLAPLRDFLSVHMSGVSDDVVRARVCMYTNAPESRFIVSFPEQLPGVTVLSACSGHGFSVAPVVGELVADLIIEGRRPPAIVRTI